jgi:hypothetical protein
MTDLSSADLDGDGIVTEEEHAIYIDKLRREMEDEDARRDAMRMMTYLSLSGMLLFPFSVVITEALGLARAGELLTQMSNIYYVSIAAIVASYFGFSSVKKKEEKSK